MKKALTSGIAVAGAMATALATALALSATAGAAGYGKDDQQKAAGKDEQGGVIGMSFERLDTDNNGYVSQREVQQQTAAGEPRPELIERWDTADKDQDGRLDKSEFSAFEEMHQGGMQRQGQMQQEGMQQPKGPEAGY